MQIRNFFRPAHHELKTSVTPIVIKSFGATQVKFNPGYMGGKMAASRGKCQDKMRDACITVLDRAKSQFAGRPRIGTTAGASEIRITVTSRHTAKSGGVRRIGNTRKLTIAANQVANKAFSLRQSLTPTAAPGSDRPGAA